MAKFFWNNASGANADIERHRKQEQELRARIAELEDKTDPMSVRAVRTYRHFLNQLLQSKAEVTDKLGKK